MVSKITLKLDDHTIESAKVYAKKQGTTPSKVMEGYLKLMLKGKREKGQVIPTRLVKDLTGVINLPKNFNYKTEYSAYLTEKYK